MNVASFGGGVNSTAMLIGCHQRGIPVHLVLFANTGGEKPETYAYKEKFNVWLVANGMPSITVVRKTSSRDGRYYGPGEVLDLESYCLNMGTLPSIAYGYKTCSLKFKQEPQRKFVEAWEPAYADWLCGKPVTKLIGFDADEPHRAIQSPEPGYVNRYPLIEWQWGREECEQAIADAGLCVPPKSSCFFCPNMEELEILQLRDEHPDLLERALKIEENAPTHGSIKGLGRDYSWKQILEFDAAQGSFFPRTIKRSPCECYDGGAL